MKKLFPTITLIFLIPFSVLSQPCLPDGITFTTQEKINNFQTNCPNCTEIEGDVIINGFGITNLNGLNVLTSIGGNITLRHNASLSNLTGLDNIDAGSIKQIGGLSAARWQV